MVTFLGLLKLLAAAITAFFSGYGITHDFKKDGQVTREGRLALYGVIAAGFLTLLAQTFETAKANEDAAAGRESSNALMREVIRGVFPLKDISLDVQYNYTDNIKEVSSFLGPYEFWLIQGEREILSRHPAVAAGQIRTVNEPILGAELTVDSDGSPVLLRFSDGSPLFPRGGKFNIQICQTICDHSFHITFYSTSDKSPAFEIDSKMQHEKIGFMMNKNSTSLTLWGEHLPVDYGYKNGNLQGVADLANVEGSLDLDVGDQETEQDRADRLSLLGQKLTMFQIEIRIGNTGCLIESEDMTDVHGQLMIDPILNRPMLRWYFKMSEDPISSCRGTLLGKAPS